MKRNQPKKVERNQCCDRHGSPNEFSYSCTGHSQYPFMRAVAVFVKQGTSNSEWKQKVQPARSDASPNKMLNFISGLSFPPGLNQFFSTVHNLAGILLAFGIILIIVGLFVWLFKTIKKQKCYPLEPFAPLWDYVGQLIYFGLVFTFIGSVFYIF